MTNEYFIAIMLLSPLVGFLINGIFGRGRWGGYTSGAIATFFALTSFASAAYLVFGLTELADGPRIISATFFDWITVDELKIPARFVVDPISAIMVLVVTGVGTLIHLFSIGYMHEDRGVTKYFSYLNFFLFNMLVLVTGDSLPIMFVGWEGVGLASYLLIGFWFNDEEKATAGMKAFITNRIGDAAFIIGMFILFFHFGTLEFEKINSLVPVGPTLSWLSPLTLGTLLLFIGATGKSAQIPLYVWLPDAMAGPTPVSALIHAATMVTAGVYMIVRLSFLFAAAPYTLMVIAIIGALTVVLAATIGLAQWDIKKVLAYSTVSQLGYMFLACGVGAFGAALFHLMTHAFFKALMFLGSGSVIHGMHHEQDMRRMGGLKKYLPITYFTFLAGWLAIIGMPPFAGFFSKDEILWQSFSSSNGHWIFWAIGVLGATLTSFYMTRLMALTFWGQERFDKKHHHPHESPYSMLIPLIALAVLSIVGGWLGIPHVISEVLPAHPANVLEHWLEGSLVHPIAATAVDGGHADHAALEWGLMGLSVGLALLSAVTAYVFYIVKPEIPKLLAQKLGQAYELVFNKYYVDEIYQRYILNPLVKASEDLWLYVDVRIIDKLTYVLTDMSIGTGKMSKAMQTGNIQTYALYIVMGVAIILTIFFGV